MFPSTEPFRHDPEWLEIVGRLIPRAEALTEDFLKRFPTLTVYDDVQVDADDVQGVLETTFAMYLQLLQGLELTPELRRLPESLGRRRAQQGVPLEKLLQGVRTNSRVMWNALRESSSPLEAPVLVRHADILLSLVEWHVTSVQEAYLREAEILSRDHGRRVRRLMGKLFSPSGVGRAEIEMIAEGLGVDQNDDFEVLAQLEFAADERLVDDGKEGWLTFELSEGTCSFRPMRGIAEHAPVTVRGGYVPHVHGLSEVPHAAAAAFAMVRHDQGDRGRPVTMDDVWPNLALTAINGILPAYVTDRITGLLELPRDELSRLLLTIQLYFECGSLKTSAERLYCHRNTVIKRLARVEELTGLRVAIPQESSLLRILLADPRLEARDSPVTN